jgi:hypothetical protein
MHEHIGNQLVDMEIVGAEIIQTANVAERNAHALHDHIQNVCCNIQEQQCLYYWRYSHFFQVF